MTNVSPTLALLSQLWTNAQLLSIVEAGRSLVSADFQSHFASMNRRLARHRTRVDSATEGGAEPSGHAEGQSDLTMQPLASPEVLQVSLNKPQKLAGGSLLT